MLTRDQILHIAKLARLVLTEEEIDRFGQQINAVFDYMHILDEVNVEGIEATSQVTGLSHVLRKDIVGQDVSPEDLLNLSQYPVEDHHIKVKKVL